MVLHLLRNQVINNNIGVDKDDTHTIFCYACAERSYSFHANQIKG